MPTITVNGVTVSREEFQRTIDKSLLNISTLTTTMTKVEGRIDKAVKDAKVLAGESVVDYHGKMTNIDDLTPAERKILFFNVYDDEESFEKLKSVLKATATVVKDIAESQFDADKVLMEVLSYQRDIANEMKFLYGIAAVNSHQCRWVAESITKRIKGLSQGELNDAEIECLNNVLKDLELQRKHFSDFVNLGSRIQNNKDDIQKMQELGERHSQDLERQREKDVEHDKELSRQRDRGARHDQLLTDLEKRVAFLEARTLPLWAKAIMIAQSFVLIGIIIWLIFSW